MEAARFPNEIALMLLSSKCGGDKTEHLRLYDPFEGSLTGTSEAAGPVEAVKVFGPERTSQLGYGVLLVSHRHPNDSAQRLQRAIWKSGGLKHYVTLYQGQSLACGLGLKCQDIPQITLFEKDLKRWMRATVAMRQDLDTYSNSNGILNLPWEPLQERSDNPAGSAATCRLLTDIDSLTEFVLSFTLRLGLSSISSIYGCLHLTAWSFEFPTYAEKIMWRTACIFIAGISAVCCSISACIILIPVRWQGSITEAVTRFFVEGPTIGLVGFTVTVYFLLYLLSFSARLFLIVESFISVRRLPLGVFVTVDWSIYVPHL